MASQYSVPSTKANLGYSGFPYNTSLKFSSTTGELLPVYFDILQPKDKVRCKTTLRTRTLPLESAAFAKIIEHLEWFFVPMEQIYSLFPDFFYGVEDIKSSVFSSRVVSRKLPFISANGMTDLYKYVPTHPDEYFMDADHPIFGTEFRLMEMLGFPLTEYNPAEASAQEFTFPYAVAPILACAYQKIYNDYYRDQEHEASSRATSYNLDQFYDQASIDDTSFSFMASMFRLRYRRWRHDYMNFGFNSPLFGSESIGSSGYAGLAPVNGNVDLTSAFQQWLVGTDFYTSKAAVYDVAASASNLPSEDENPTSLLSKLQQGSTTITNTFHNIQQALSPASIRTSFAVQKLLEVTRRAGKNFSAQQLAHFGIDVPLGINGRVTPLGHTESMLVIGDVISTAGTDDQALGTVGGKGYNFDESKPITFEAPTHGILMCIYSAEPIADYQQHGLDPFHLLVDTNSWPRPEFDNLGAEPMFGYESRMSFAPTGGEARNNNIDRWKYRFHRFKSSYNRVTGAMMRSLKTWTPARYGMGTDLKDYLIPPYYLDSIMVKNFEFNPDHDIDWSYEQLFDSDPLIHLLEFSIQKASTMSTYGLEQL